MVTKHVSEYANADWPEELVALIEQLHYYNEQLMDFTQAQILQGLGKGVDVRRFAADSQYKRETILGLAETLEENVYKIALSLAHRYNVPLWEVYMTHLEFLFTDSGLSTVEIEERARILCLFETLKSNPVAFYEHMAKYVYPSIESRDLQRMLYYYSLLESCGCAHLVKKAIKPDTHVKLLKKLKAVAPGLNYKQLTDEHVSPLVALEPVLTSQNVLSISKLAAKIPERDGRMLTPSSVHATWLQKLFWNGDPQLLMKTPQSGPDWSQAYDICAKYFDRLLPGDMVAFLDEITFSAKAVNKLSIESRTQMTKKAIGAIKLITERKGKKTIDDGRAGSSPITYEETLKHLKQSLAHLATLSHDLISNLRTTDQDVLQKYAHLYDLSRSEKEKIRSLAVTMCLEGQSLDMIQQLLQLAVGPLGISPRDVVQSAVQKVIVSLSGDDSLFTSPADSLQILEGIVSAVHASVVQGERLVSSDDLLEWLRPFCGDDSLPVKPRIDILQIMEQAFHLSDEDIKLLVFFRTEAVLKACWPEKKVDISDIESEEKRHSLFLALLGSSQSAAHFQHLALLLEAWPPVTSLSLVRPNNNPWIKLGVAMLTCCPADQRERTGSEVLSLCRSLYKKKHKLSAECIKEVSLLLRNQSLLLPSLKLLVESQEDALHAVALEQITAVTKVDCSNCDSELLSLMLDAKLTVKCVSTAFYPHLIDHLLSKQSEGLWDVEEIAQQLRATGCIAEAGSLMMSYRGTHPALRTFSAALSTVKRWL